VSAQSVTDPAANALPDPTPNVEKNWAPLPGGRIWGATAGIDIGPDGHIWAYDRCGAVELRDPGCETRNIDAIFKFDHATGELLASFGAGEFVVPHGFHVDADGNVWVTDWQGNDAGTRGHQVIKFSPEGDVLLRLGEAGVPGDGPGQLNEPNDVITAPNGDIFVGDGHSGQYGGLPPDKTGRIVKYDKDGNFIREWGMIGEAPGDFRTPHALAFDSRGRLFVADRGNHRIQIFDQDGNYIDSYYQFGRVSGLFITADDTLYAIDSESDDERHPNWRRGIRIGHAGRDEVTAFVPPHDTGDFYGAAGEGIAVDSEGNIFAAEGPNSRAAAGGGITKYSP
jgi:sugar lactone lactonase YvrE